ncbi:MAG: sulfite exporter TauE/SafE family protein [Desulfovibrio sp.]
MFGIEGITAIEAAMIFGVMFIGTVIQASAGLGLGLIALPVLLMVDDVFIPAPLAVSGIVLLSMTLWRDFSSVEWSGLKKIALPMALGCFVGGQVLALLPQHLVGLFFGGIILLAVAISFGGLTINKSPLAYGIGGFLGGFMATVAAIGGPPIALLYQHDKGPVIRGTLSAIFMAVIMMSLVSLYFVGKFGVPELKAAGILVPGVITGFIISKFSAKWLDKGKSRMAVLLISGLSAIVLIAKSVQI